MITWRRSPVACLCGGCGAQINRGEPEQVLTFLGIQKRRGVCCVGPAPPDLPALSERTAITPTSLSRLVSSSASRLPLDWKARSAGEREPGEEG